MGRKIHVVTREGPPFADRLTAMARGAGVDVVRVEAVPPSFEDIFMHLSQHAVARQAD